MTRRLIDRSRCPIDPRDPGHDDFVEKCRSDYLDTGIVALAGFLTAEALDAICAETNDQVDDAWFASQNHTVYLAHDGVDGITDPLDPRVRMLDTSVGSIAYDQLPPNSTLAELYNDDTLMRFIGAVLGHRQIHRLADPLGACSVNVYRNGDEHNWHFDESATSITLLAQQPERGGAFEYVPNVRGTEAELDVVADVLDGRCADVTRLPFQPGMLLIFAGHRTLHRVTPVGGETPRLVPVLCYAEEPDIVNSNTVRQMFWGRTEPVR